MSIPFVCFLALQVCFQAKTLEHVEVREVNHDPSLYFLAFFDNEPGMRHDCAFHWAFVDNVISPNEVIFVLQSEHTLCCNKLDHDHTMNKE